MSPPRSSKRDLERQRRERAARKAAKRKARQEPVAQASDSDAELVPQDVILERLAVLHERRANEQIDADEFEQERDRLLAQLRVD